MYMYRFIFVGLVNQLFMFLIHTLYVHVDIENVI